MNSTEHHGSTIKKRIIRPSEQPVASPVETTKNSAPIKSIKKVIRVQDKYWTNISGAYRIDPESLHNFLGQRGYRTYKPEGVRTTVLVNVDNNRVREISTQEIWELCW